MGLFFSSSLPKLPCYNDILCRIKSGGVFLDLGCHCGTDLRQLMFDGCPQTNLYGMDLVDHWRLGYALYRDEGRFNVKYIKADLLNPSMELFALTDKIDVMGATHLLHNWDWTTQIRGATTMIKLSKVGTMIVGFQIGTVNEGLTWSLENGKDRPILHNLSTFGRVWDEAAKITGTEWRVSSRLREWKDLDYDSKETVYLGGDSCILEFIIRRIS
jgi:hypothetical protein